MQNQNDNAKVPVFALTYVKLNYNQKRTLNCKFDSCIHVPASPSLLLH